MNPQSWNLIDADTGVAWSEYKFTKAAKATSMAFRGEGGGMVVVSPGVGLTDAAFEAVSALGDVRALIANNAFHHLGHESWRARFKNASSYAASGALGRLAKKASVAFRPLSELPLPQHVSVEEVPGFKNGETIVIVRTKRGPIWYTGDVLTNIEELPPPPMRWLFTLTDSAPGFKLFKPAAWFFIRDKQAARRWLLERIVAEPPVVAIPAHGRPVEGADLAARAKAQLERLG